MKKLVLEGDTKGTVLKLLSADVAKKLHPQGACGHHPTHSLRIWQGKNVIFLQTFCGHCRNFTFEYPDHRTELLNLSPELAELLPELMPIPQAELDRFRKKSGFPAETPRSEE